MGESEQERMKSPGHLCRKVGFLNETWSNSVTEKKDGKNIPNGEPRLHSQAAGRE